MASNSVWTALSKGLIAATLLVLMACHGNAPDPSIQFSGRTMGTAYHVTLARPPTNLPPDTKQQIDTVLGEVDRLMSTYQKDSDIRRLNRAEIGEWVAVSPKTLEVVAQALEFWRLSKGSFNPAVGALVELWGFGATERQEQQLPPESAIQTALQMANPGLLELRAKPASLRRLGALELDLSAIAKGYGVDQVANLLDSLQVESYLVEVGGELRLKGHNAAGSAWQLGIEQPDAAYGVTHQRIAVATGGVATSGDYRNYFEQDGRRYSHTIDPATGYPVNHALASVTVIANTAAIADALATAINVMGPEEGKTFALQHRLAVYLIIKSGKGFVDWHSPEFSSYLVPAD